MTWARSHRLEGWSIGVLIPCSGHTGRDGVWRQWTRGLRGSGIPVGDACKSWVRGGTRPMVLPKRPLPQAPGEGRPSFLPTPCSALAVVGSALRHPYLIPQHLPSSLHRAMLRGIAGTWQVVSYHPALCQGTVFPLS